MWDNKDEQRFDFYIKVSPKARGDFGCIRVGGLNRDIKECLSIYEDMKEQIKRHVDNVEDVQIVIEDVYGEFETIEGEYSANRHKNKLLTEFKKRDVEND